LIDNIPAVKETVQNVMAAILPIIEPILKGVLELFKSVFALLNGDFDTFKESFLKALKLLLEGIYKALELAVQTVIEIVVNLGKALFSAGQEAFEFLFDGMKGVWSKIENWVKEKVEWLTDKLKFWESGSSKMESDSSKSKNSSIYRHASGLAYVPYDGYKAELHKGETILNSDDTKKFITDLINGISRTNNSGGETINLKIVTQLGGADVGEQIYKLNLAAAKKHGSALVEV
ncbi:MAG: hypothetical protein ACOCM4_09680, partial [Acetivibrio ethanolgignens]